MARKCVLCGNSGKRIFEGKIMGKYNITYYQCKTCGLIYTEEVYWLEEAYSKAIADGDVGIMSRNINNTLLTNIIINKYFDCRGKFLDYGGGVGCFVRMMRDIGFDFFWFDKYCNNFMAKGFEYTTGSIELLCAWELFEHYENPRKEIDYLFSIADSILFSTLLYDDKLKIRSFDEWWYYAPQSGQHICFYSKMTLEYIARTYHVHYYKISDEMHLFTKKICNEKILQRITCTKVGKLYQWLTYLRQKVKKVSLQSADFKKMNGESK